LCRDHEVTGCVQITMVFQSEKPFSYHYVQILQVLTILGIIRRLRKLLVKSVCGFRTEKYWTLCISMDVKNYALKF
jgi:hypothetical protein